MHDFVLADRAGLRSDLLAVVNDHLLDGGVRNRVATTGFVAVPAQSGLLAEATLFAQPVGDFRVLEVGPLAVAPLANGPADVVARQIRHAERAHRHAPGFQRAVHLTRRGTFLQQEQCLADVLLDHAVTDEAVAYARDHRGLPDPLRQAHARGEDVLGCLPAAHDL